MSFKFSLIIKSPVMKYYDILAADILGFKEGVIKKNDSDGFMGRIRKKIEAPYKKKGGVVISAQIKFHPTIILPRWKNIRSASKIDQKEAIRCIKVIKDHEIDHYNIFAKELIQLKKRMEGVDEISEREWKDEYKILREFERIEQKRYHVIFKKGQLKSLKLEQAKQRVRGR